MTKREKTIRHGKTQTTHNGRKRRATNTRSKLVDPNERAKQDHDTASRQRIVGGEETIIEQYPWQVAIRESYGAKTQFCGGSILTTRWVITAAHCTNEIENKNEIIITVGHTYSSYGEAREEPLFQESRVQAIIENKRWYQPERDKKRRY